MLHKFMHVVIGLSLTVLFSAQVASAVSFGQMDVASHLGEPFYAEMPLDLGENESLAKTSVELGGTSDYRILEVYRNQILNAIRVDIVDDERGARAVLSSEAAIDAAFFNLVLKVRYGRSTHFKKIPVFLEIANRGTSANKDSVPVKMAPPISSATVVPETSNAFIAKAPEDLLYPDMGEETELDALNVEVKEPVAEEPAFQAYEGWARTSRYGPMVFGDTITTVAKRLRVDEQFTNQQVMVALFEKNREQFDKDNINLIKTNTYLNVPTAQEVSSISPKQARQTLLDQDKTWRAMQGQSKYAAIAQAQKTRYSSRVRMGQAAPVQQEAAKVVPGLQVNKAPEVIPANDEILMPVSNVANTEALTALSQEKNALAEALHAKEDSLSAVQQKLSDMQQRLDVADKKAADLEQKVAEIPATPADSAATEAQNKRLELMISRLKNELEQSKVNANQPQGVTDWVMYVLAALGLLVLGLLAAVVMLMRRQHEQHPAEKELDETNLIEEFDESSVSTKVMSADDFDLAMADAAALENKAPEKTSEDSFDPFEDHDLDDIPELTDEDTGEIEAFNPEQDEIPDPSVNYLEEADVYLRYGMEDEAEKQVKMALKLNGEDPLAHAKLVQLRLAQGDQSGATALSNAAKALLSGAALLAFENAMAGEGSDDAPEMAAQSSDIRLADLNEPEGMTDTGIVDFGEINFDNESNVSAHADAKEDFDFDFSDMGAANENTVEKVEDGADADALFETQSESTDGLDFDFGDFNISSEVDSEASEADAITDVAKEVSDGNDGDLDFSFSDFDFDEVEVNTNEDDSNVDLESTVMVKQVGLAGNKEALQSFDLDGDSLTDASEIDDAMIDSIGLESLGFDIDDIEDFNVTEVASDDDAAPDILVDKNDLKSESFDTLDDAQDSMMEDSFGLDSLDFDMSSLDQIDLSDDANEANDESADELPFVGDNEQTPVLEKAELDALDEGEDLLEGQVDFENLDFDLGDLVETEESVDTATDWDKEKADKDTAGAVSAESNDLSDPNDDTGMDTSDLENMTIDFSNMDMSSLGSMDDIVEPPEDDLLSKDVANESEAEDISQLNESIDLSDFDMPEFATDFDDDDLVSAMGDDVDLDATSLIADANETVALGNDAPGIEDERNDYEVEKAQRLADEEANAAVVDLDTNANDPFAVASEQLQKAHSEKVTDEWLHDGLDASLDNMAGLQIDELSLAEKVIEDSDTLAGEDTGMVDFGEINFDDMGSSESPTKQDKSDESDDLGLDDFDFSDDMLTDLDDHVDEFTDLENDTDQTHQAASHLQSSNNANYDATVIINRNSELEQEKLAKTMQEQKEEKHLAGLDEAIDESSLMIDKNNPMADPFSATEELGKIHDDMVSLGEGFDDAIVESGDTSSELENLLNDLDGLLDEDNKKK